MEFLLLAVRDRLRDQLGLSAEECDVRPGPEPPAVAGEVFLAVHPDGVNQLDDEPHKLDEEYDVGLTLTMRSGWLPVDRLGVEQTAKAQTGLYARLQQARALMHGKYEAINAANAAINAESQALRGTDENGFIEPFTAGRIGAPEPKYSDWFGAANLSEEPETAPAGYALHLPLRGARRVQTLEDMD